MSNEENETRREGKVPEERNIEPRVPHDIFHTFDAMWEDFRRNLMRPWRYWDRDPRIWGILTQRKACSDLIDTGTEYQVCVEVPGITKDQIDITVTKDDIKITGKAAVERRGDETGFVVRERGYSEIYRKMAFPDAVIPERAEATITDGLLNITIPKKTSTPDDTKHKVEIK
jgi:HSP20 family protein